MSSTDIELDKEQHGCFHGASRRLLKRKHSETEQNDAENVENKSILLVMTGERDFKHFSEKSRNFNILDMAAEAEGLLAKLSVENIKKYDYNAQNALMDYSIEYKSRNNVICNIISFSGKFLNSIGIERPVIICQIPF